MTQTIRNYVIFWDVDHKRFDCTIYVGEIETEADIRKVESQARAESKSETVVIFPWRRIQ